MIKNYFTRRNTVILIAIILVVSIMVFFRYFSYRNGINKDIEQYQQQNVQAIQQQYVQMISQEEIESNAIESYLWRLTLNAFPLAQAAGVDSREYRDYEQKYAEYRTFRDSRILRMMERQQR